MTQAANSNYSRKPSRLSLGAEGYGSEVLAGPQPEHWRQALRPEGEPAGYVQQGDLSDVFVVEQGDLSDVFVVGYSKLKKLFKPAHRYFVDKRALILKWHKYRCRISGVVFAFPELGKIISHPLNPYVLHRKASQSACKSIRKLKEVVKAYGLDRAKILDFVFTFPVELSEALVSRADGVKLAWKMWQGFWRESLERFLGGHRPYSEAGCHVNLHIWSTANPLRSHFHFHCLALDWVRVFHSAENQVYGVDLARVAHFLERNEREDRLRELKELWTKHLLRLAKKLGVKVPLSLEEEKLADVHFEYIPWSNMPKIVHKFQYVNRHPLEDFAIYSNEHPDCDDPPFWLGDCANRARCYGWFRRFRELLEAKIDKEGCEAMVKDKGKLCPCCGEPMVEVGTFELRGKDPPGRLIAFEWVKGKPKLIELSTDDIEFLRRCEGEPSG